MPRILNIRCISSFLFCILLSSQIFAFPLEVLNDPDFILPIDREQVAHTPITISTAQENDVSSNQYKSGDTVDFICSEQIFTTSVGGGSDCWGWVDGDGTEYAIYGTWNTIEFYNLSTGTLVDAIAAPSSSWHDIKTYQHYCYSVAEAIGTNDGLSVIDMQYLPDSVHFVTNVEINNLGHRTSHNLSIDTAQGYAYLEGTSDQDFSVHILSLANPENPVYINSFGPAGGLHDMFCHNDTLYLAEGWNPTLSIWDMANKNAPALLTRWTIPLAGYVHNIWPTGDKRHVLTTEETSGKTIKLWNIEDFNNIQLMDEYLAPSGLAHNAHIVGDTAYISHYESGVAVLDLSDPSNIKEIGLFDTYLDGEGGDFNGCWGVYPHTSVEGKFYASNMEGQLYILKKNDAILADTIIALDAQALPGSSVRIDLWANFTLPIHEFEIPYNWGGALNLSYDSASTFGLMTEYFEVQQLTAVDLWNKRAAYLIRTTNSDTSPELPAGEGIILSLYFTIPGSANGAANPITFTPFNGKEPSFRNRCLFYTPDTLNGSVSLGDPPCCVDIRGNVDNDILDAVDISDLVFVVDFIFTGGPAPVCSEEADVTADAAVDISDLVYLVDFIFTGGPDPLVCP